MGGFGVGEWVELLERRDTRYKVLKIILGVCRAATGAEILLAYLIGMPEMHEFKTEFL